MAFKPSISCFSCRAPVLWWADRYDITPLFGAGLILLFYLNMIAAWNLDLQDGERRLHVDNPHEFLDPGDPFCCHSWLSLYCAMTADDQMLVDHQADRADLVALLLQTRSCEQLWNQAECERNIRIHNKTSSKSLQIPVSYLFLGVWPICNFQPCFSVHMDCFHAPWLS